MSDDLAFYSAIDLVKAFRSGQITPVDAAVACLNQIKKLDGKINAMSFIEEATTLKMAKASALRWKKNQPLSALDGVPVLIKDLLLVKTWPTMRGSRTIDRDQTWDHEAPSVARLREAGCVFMGMTTTPEFGWKGVTDSPLTGITRNPWNYERTPGGSSGGSAAGLAAGYAPLAIGTDGGGSIRIPASFTGVYGLKPSFGRVPAWPSSPFASVAHVGPMTRHVKDAALFLNVLAQPDDRDFYALPFQEVDYFAALSGSVKGLRIAYSPRLGFDVEVAPDVARCIEDAVRALRKAGAKITEIDPGFVDPAATFKTIWWLGVRGAFGKMSEDKLALMEFALREVLEQSKSITIEEVLEANLQRGLLGSHMRQFMTKYDALITPTIPITAFEAGAMQPGEIEKKGKWVNWTPFTYPFNLTGQPAASVPIGLDQSGLPIGLQIVGRMHDDKTVLQVSDFVESTFGSFKPIIY